jgi:hypothetical protein
MIMMLISVWIAKLMRIETRANPDYEFRISLADSTATDAVDEEASGDFNREDIVGGTEVQ